MSILVDGILKSSAGNVIGNADIVLTAISTSLVVLGGTPLSIKTDADGRYSFTLHNGNYAVSVSKDGNNWFSGMITVTDLTVPKSINALLLQDAMMAEIPADYWSYFQAQTGILFTSFEKIDEAVSTTVSSKEITVAARDETVAARDIAKASAEIAQNIADANTFYISTNDPDGTIAGLSNTPSGQSFRVGQGPGRGFKYYFNDNGSAIEISESAGQAALTNLQDNTVSALDGMYRYHGGLNVSVYQTDVDGRLIHWIDHNVNKLFFRGKPMQEELDEETFNSIQTPILQPKFEGMFRYDGSLNVSVFLTDVDGRLTYWIDHNTNKVMFRGRELGANSPFISPLVTIDAIGDSLTNGQAGVTPWRVQLASLISDRTITNYGIGGQTSGMIASRLGIQRPLITVEGNTIPATGFVNVTACKIVSQTAGLVDERPLTSQGYQTMTGALAGVPGVFSRIGGSGGDANSFIFTRSTTGDVVRCWPNTPFILEDNGMAFHTKVIGIGRNDCSGLTIANYAERMLNLKYRIDRFVARIETAEKRYFILTPPTAEGEVLGSVYSNFIIEYENYVQDKYGDRVLNQRTFSFQFSDGSALDDSFVAQGIPPASMRVPGDALHFNTMMHGHVAEWLANQINIRGW